MNRQAGALTLFTIPKPFSGSTDVAQRNAIRSWKKLSPFVEIVLFGDEPGTTDVAQELGIRHVPTVQKNSHGTPVVGSAFSLVHEYSKTPYLAYCNCDVILFEDFVEAVQRLINFEPLDRFVAIGQRTNYLVDGLIDFDDPQDVAKLRTEVGRNGKLESLVCKEFFVFNRGLFDAIPNFAVGRGHWDNWIIHNAKQRGIPVVTLTDCVLTLHQEHGYEHLQGGRLAGYVSGDEARENQLLGQGKHIISGSTSDYRMEPNGIRPNRMKSVAGEFWSDFPKFAQLLMKIVGNR